MKVMNKKALLTLAAVGAVASAMAWGLVEGTPGYWKNKGVRDGWPYAQYQPGTLVVDVFSSVPGGAGEYFEGWTLLDALQGTQGDGSTLEGAIKILLRAATASLNNSFSDPLTSAAAVINPVNAAIDSGDRGQILVLASALDDWNNGLPYPLD